MTFSDKIDLAIKQIETSYPSGLSNTSTRRFDGLIPIISELVGLPKSDMYPTYVNRASNVLIRLGQGKTLRKHFSLAVVLGSEGDGSGILPYLSGFIGEGFYHYDTIVIITPDTSKHWAVRHVVTNAKDDCVLKIRQAYPSAVLHLLNLSLAPNMAVVRACVFNDLENKFREWLPKHDVTSPAKINDYVLRLKAMFEPPVPHTKPTERWFGLYHDLMGENPACPVFAISGKKDFEKKFGAVIPFFKAEFEDKEKVQELYSSCPDFDRIFSFVHAAPAKTAILEKDNQTTRCGFRKFLQFLDDMETLIDEQSMVALSRQIIIYGAPGTGKSFEADKTVKKVSTTIRTTFHPDSDYASFVGCYKPTMDQDNFQTIVTAGKKNAKGTIVKNDELVRRSRIVYKFVPQAFTKAYELAWRKMSECKDGDLPTPQFLVIEEINRGNCAQIFGDLFQLLDRDGATGYSRYPIDLDSDLTRHLQDWFRGNYKDADGTASPKVVGEDDGDKWKIKKTGNSETSPTWDDVFAGRKLVLPPNLYIWATMNTSDQSLFPMDSAFKRRWDWKYVPIRNHPEENWTIVVDEKRKYDWWDFLKKVNKEIFTLTSSEDKQLGYFFVQAKGKTVDLGTFVNKVVFYLWNAVFKDSYTECEFLKDGKDADGAPTYLHFAKFFDETGNPVKDAAAKLLDALHVDPPKKYASKPGAAQPDATGSAAGTDHSGAADATAGEQPDSGGAADGTDQAEEVGAADGTDGETTAAGADAGTTTAG